MAPLLGRKPYPLFKSLAEPPGSGEEIYIIPHTQEAFRDKEEYEARLQRYSEHIWTCKSTGSGQLTHKEAWEEEKEVAELLKEEYPLWFEKPVLEMVHHNTLSLDKLVDQAWLEIFTKYAVGEECDFLVGKDRSLRVKVLEVLPLEGLLDELGEKKVEGACDSPSSDKENTSREQLKVELQPEEESRRSHSCDRARRSPRKLPTSLKEHRKKWVMPKFLPHKYNVKLMDEDQLISNVPADGLFRTERPPNKEIVRYFIRHNALRLGTGESAPWVVEDELVKKYSLPSKFSDFLLDPCKYMADTPSSKRKSLSLPEGKPGKKTKTTDGEDAAEKGARKKLQKTSPQTLPLGLTTWGHVQKEENGSPLKVKNGGSPKKRRSSSGGDSGVHVSQARRHGRSVAKAAVGQKTSRKSESKPKMKQMTLLEVTKTGSSATPKKLKSRRPGTPKPGKPLPPMALHLLRYYRENKDKEEKRNALSCLVSKVAKVLAPEDRTRLPEDLRDMVQKRWELLEYKRRWAAMTEEEKQDAMRKKREEIKEKLRERAKERREKEMLVRREAQRRYEDQELVGKNIPNFKLADMPDGLPNVLFGDIAMVTDFLNCYSGLLMPEDQTPITAAALMEALATKQAGLLYLNRVLVILLQTLLQDELAEGYNELDMPLSEIPLTMHSVSELVRLCLRPRDAHEEGSGRGSEDWAWGVPDDTLSTEILERLETSEVFELNPQEKIGLLVALCHRILLTYSVEDHVEAMQQRAAELWKERLATLKEANSRVRAEKQRRKEQMEAKVGGGDWVKVEGSGAGGAAKQDKRRDGGAKKECGGGESVAPEPLPEDMVSVVRSRRLQTIQAKKEKEEQERMNKERMEKEAGEERQRKRKAAAERAFQEGISKAKLILRRMPLGTDRNHSRYWLFSDAVPGLYIEKGWVHDSINYSFTLPPKEEEEEEDDDGVDEPESREECSTDGGQQGTPETPVESTVPKRGQNLWFVCDSLAQLQELMDSLHPQGVRESELKNHLQYRYQDIQQSIGAAQKASSQQKTCDSPLELLHYLQNDILEVASRLQRGGLGDLDHIGRFEDKVRSLVSLKDLGQCIVTLQESVFTKFLQGFMDPKQNKRKKKQNGEEGSKVEEAEEEKRLADEARVATAVEKWKAAIREAQTFSRMHVLLGMLDASVKWDMSAENARCKVCRRKGEDDKLILCDKCLKAFHLFCLRPALYSIPDRDWLCLGCQPALARRHSHGRSYEEDSDEDEEEEDEEEENDEEDENSEEDEDDKNEDDKDTGHYLRSRKARGKKSCGRKAGAKSRGGQQKESPNNAVDIDELVQQNFVRGGCRRALELDCCEIILQRLVKFRYSWPFRKPVSPDLVEDYRDVISQPMNFQTMLCKFSDGHYRHSGDFLEDMKLVFSNAEEYNPPDSPVLSCLLKTERVFVDLLGQLLPGLTYFRRHKRACRNRGEEEEEEEEAAPPEEPRRAARQGRPGGNKRQEYGDGLRKSGQRGLRSEEEESSCEEEEEDGGLRKSRRAAVLGQRKNYREVESDSDREEAVGHRKRGRGRPPRDSRQNHTRCLAEAGDGKWHGASLRHSKRQKPSL